jgi:hypothetical protein
MSTILVFFVAIYSAFYPSEYIRRFIVGRRSTAHLNVDKQFEKDLKFGGFRFASTHVTFLNRSFYTGDTLQTFKPVLLKCTAMQALVLDREENETPLCKAKFVLSP